MMDDLDRDVCNSAEMDLMKGFGENMKHAKEIKFGEAYIGMKFNYTSLDKIKDGEVTALRKTKTGRIKIEVNGMDCWHPAPCSPNTMMQD